MTALNPSEALQVGIRRAGGVAAFCAAMTVSRTTVYRWINLRVPAERVVDIERITGIARSDLRPDLYPSASEAAA